MLLESIDHQAHSCHEGNGLFGRSFVEQLVADRGVSQHLVGYYNVSLGHCIIEFKIYV